MANRIVTPPEGWSQAKQRALGVFYDQHRSTVNLPHPETGAEHQPFLEGRPWWADIEKSTGMPVGPLYPMGWQAPWVPPQHYINQSIGKVDARGHVVTNAAMQLRWFRIDYEGMEKEYREAMQSYYRLAVEESARLNLFPLPDYGDPITFKLKSIIGPPPMSPKIPAAAKAGHPWLLGQAKADVWDKHLNRMVVEEDEVLARLLVAPSETLMTAVQAERKAVEKEETAEVIKAMQATIEELLTERRAEKAEAAAKKQADTDRMAKARAAKKVPKGKATVAGA